MIYDGTDLSAFFIVAQAGISVMPEVEWSTVETPGMDGSIPISRKLLPRTIQVQVLVSPNVSGDTRIQKARALASVLSTDSPKPLYLDGDSDRYYLAVLDGASDLDSLWRHGGGTLTFTAHDPVAYGSVKAAESSTGAVSMSIGGTYPTWPIVTAKPVSGSSELTVTDYATGKRVRVLKSFAGTETVTFDFEHSHVEINGVPADGYVTLESDYFKLNPGTADIRCTGASFKVEVVERWL